MAGRDVLSHLNLAGGAKLTGQVSTWNIPIGDGVAVIPTGAWLWFKVDYDCELTIAALAADAVGSLVVDLYVDTHANFPPVVGDKITASAPPTLSGARTSLDSTLTGWTKAIAAGSWVLVQVTSATTVKLATLALTHKRT